MSQVIKILPDFISNQIAAGEVVQRPESVVKELVENSIDAGATEIFVTIKDAGKSLIHIVDNGKGMSKEDLELSIKRHATSKVFTQEDIESIKSFGFRGEALASISAVAKLEIKTKQENEQLGWVLNSEPNSEVKLEPEDLQNGTQILVKNLFYNTPARRKFLRANLTEYRHILDTMNKFALSHPGKKFIFYDENKLVFDLPKQSKKERIEKILGKKTFQNMIEINSDESGIKITGFLGKPDIAKVSRSNQYLFLNGRSIHNKSLNHAVISAFGVLLERNQFPVFVIFLEINPKEVDINVHPQKHEVKFEDEKQIYNLLKFASKKSLKDNNIITEFAFRESIASENSQKPFDRFNDNSEGFIVNKLTGEILPEKGFEKTENNYSRSEQVRKFNDQNKNYGFPVPDPKDVKQSAFEMLFSDDKLFESDVDRDYYQLHNKYIITKTEKGILIIDQHNAHERINYEKAIHLLDKQLATSQKLLFPEAFDVDKNQQSIIDEIKEELFGLGFEFDIDQQSLTLFAKPLDVATGNEEKEFKEILDLYQENKELGRTDKRENIAASFSCRSAIKTGKKLTQAEMKRLNDDLFKCDTPEVCPHGRPVIMEISLKELDLQFGRTPNS